VGRRPALATVPGSRPREPGCGLRSLESQRTRRSTEVTEVTEVVSRDSRALRSWKRRDRVGESKTEGGKAPPEKAGSLRLGLRNSLMSTGTDFVFAGHGERSRSVSKSPIVSPKRHLCALEVFAYRVSQGHSRLRREARLLRRVLGLYEAELVVSPDQDALTRRHDGVLQALAQLDGVRVRTAPAGE